MCPLPLLAAAVAASRTPRRLLGRGLAAAMSAAGRLKSVDYEVFGRVQGVCFRMYTEGEAKKIGVVGWVKNTSKGTVTGQVQGPEEKVNSISLQHTFLLVPLTYCSCDQLLQHMIWKDSSKPGASQEVVPLTEGPFGRWTAEGPKICSNQSGPALLSSVH
ncbi:acylphosphatase-2 isoform X4 [Mirounga leonina]|uniref:acylphosphatase-2 isoform X4 n=1 Tax=Mirounga leonina TaxID=9715 RepID=UPI00156C2B9F|nr:acylphosphatase-2 isoform X4 [Mirounga leonina]